MAKKNIYVVDDEFNIQQLIKYSLESYGFNVTCFYSGEDLLTHTNKSLPDLFILDIMLPGIDGLEVCRQLKLNSLTQNIPIIIITAKSEEFDRVLGLELGADDYMTKPFSVRELFSRIKALFRRINVLPEEKKFDIISHKNIMVDSGRREVYKDNELIDMPLKEFELLKMLISNKGQVLSRELILDKVWGIDYCAETRTVDVHIRYLRQKIEDDDENPRFIETIRGVGYRFTDNSV
ncbi:two-component system alkaline phosphatase synthesis response regulator PhoP [Ruminiclostridium sufflavum DSM 19573]|uniref:Stage 0 sporulation protein A homolog n=1 Tax=Ruminiclostridium sufflavum DSM 19573 TaxID=1121337 RepID=A0A318Y0V8_9FIRM|nr:response regulator transcription factor [Ruminiclostridium sufflavum]PYG84314.1 two-component system alkaline phosphatase synthesis response regulator PhoP [Ruminiclostridium sufflavum DSM 19573]